MTDYDNQIGDLSYDCFNKLGKSGKPNPKSEYTVLAAIVCDLNNSRTDVRERKVVALSTGTKCYPSNQCSKSDLIVDSHAESLLKRAFKRHILSQIERGFRFDDNLTVSLFVSQLPCGALQRWKGDPSLDSHISLTHSNANPDDRQLRGSNRKPGRGEACLKPTCLKKMTKWIYMGLQGKRLIQLTKHPIYINNIVIGNCGQIGEYDQKVVKDLLVLDDSDSIATYAPFDLKSLPQIKFCQQFRNELFMKSDEKQSTQTSIAMWLTGDGQPVSEVLTEGRKLGVTKKYINRSKLLISDSIINRDIDLLTTNKDYELTEIYENQWNELKKCKLFDGWPSLGSS